LEHAGITMRASRLQLKCPGCAVVRVEGCFACCEVLEAVLLPHAMSDAPTTYCRPSRLASLFCSVPQQEAAEHLVLFTRRQQNIRLCASQQNIIRQAAGVRQAFKQHQKSICLPGLTPRRREADRLLSPCTSCFAQSPKNSSNSSSSAQKACSVLWGRNRRRPTLGPACCVDGARPIASLSALTPPPSPSSSHTGKSTACIAGCLREIEATQFARPWRPARESTSYDKVRRCKRRKGTAGLVPVEPPSWMGPFKG
jgi:hypothetical protein